MFKIRDGRENFYQWDLDRQLIVDDAAITEVHFCNRTDTCSLVVETYQEDGKTLVNVPNILLQSTWRIHVYAYDTNYTKYDKCFEVAARTKPADYIYTETELKNYEEFEERLKALEDNDYDERIKALEEKETEPAIKNIADGVDGIGVLEGISASRARGDNSIALGKDTQAGARGYNVAAIDTAEKAIYLSNEKELIKGNIIYGKPTNLESFDVYNYDRGDRFYLRNGTTHLITGTIVNIEKNKITYDFEGSFPIEVKNNDYHYFLVPEKCINGGAVLISNNAFAMGNCAVAGGESSVAFGINVVAGADYAAAFGRDTIAGYAGLAAGYGARALGDNSIALGNMALAEGRYSHAIGKGIKAKGVGSFATGGFVSTDNAGFTESGAFGNYSHSEGRTTQAIGEASHSEGRLTQAKGNYSHAGGQFTKSNGDFSFAHGKDTQANGSAAVGIGVGLYANGDNQTVIGKYNVLDTDKAFIIGNGEKSANRSDAFSVDWDGNVKIAGTITDMSGNSLTGGSSPIVWVTIDLPKYNTSDSWWTQSTYTREDGSIGVYYYINEINSIITLQERVEWCAPITYFYFADHYDNWELAGKRLLKDFDLEIRSIDDFSYLPDGGITISLGGQFPYDSDSIEIIRKYDLKAKLGFFKV